MIQISEQCLQSDLCDTPHENNEVARPAVENGVRQMFGLGDVVQIDSASRSMHFVVAKIREHSDERHHPIVDYVLLNAATSSQFRLRLKSTQSANSTHTAVILSLHDSFPYDEEFHDVVLGTTKNFVIEENNAQNLFWRVNNAEDSHVGRVNVRSSDGSDDEAIVEYWDYSRLIEVDGYDTEEFVFVELNKVDGVFQIWRGVEVATRVSVAKSAVVSE